MTTSELANTSLGQRLVMEWKWKDIVTNQLNFSSLNKSERFGWYKHRQV